MPLYPLNATIQKAFRDTFELAQSPAFVDTDVNPLPVVILGQASSTSAAINVNASVTSLSLPAPSSSQTIVSTQITTASTGATIYTVTTGKTFYCTGLAYTNNGTAGAVYNIDVSGSNKCNARMATNTTTVMSGGILFSAGSGVSILLEHAAGALSGEVAMWGFEQ